MLEIRAEVVTVQDSGAGWYKLMITIGNAGNQRTVVQTYALTQPELHAAEAMFKDAKTRDYVREVRLFRQDKNGTHELKRYIRKD